MKSLVIFFAFISVINAADLICNFSPWPSCTSIYSMTAFTSPDDSVTILGQPSDYVDSNLKSLYFDNNYVLNYIPTPIFKYFPNVQTFNAINTSTIALTTDAFNNCEKLNSITITRNNIFNIDAKFAGNCHFVETVTLNYNKIQSIDEKAFEGMDSLRTLNLNHNEISCLPPLLFKSNLGLNTVDLSFNQIPAVHPLIFKDLTLLQIVYLNDNKIGYIPNMELSHTGIRGYGFFISFSNNPIMALNINLIDDFYKNMEFDVYSSISFSNYNPPYELCYDAQKHSSVSISYMYANYIKTIIKYQTNCSTNWNSDMEANKLITCGSI